MAQIMANEPSVAEGRMVRHYEPRDREAVRRICCETGFLGNPIDPVFEDRETFADFLTAYYTDAEPESSVILDGPSGVTGYVLGSRFPSRQRRFDSRRVVCLGLRVLWRYAARYNAASRAYIHWLLWRGWRETPRAPKGMAHFHINLLPGSRDVGGTRALIDFFLEYLARQGEKSVYGQMVAFDGRRGQRMFARYGFKVIDTSEVTKYRKFVDHPVFLFTVVKNLENRTRLYGNDLWKNTE